MKCTRCGKEIGEDVLKKDDVILCEDCYFDEISSLRICDPWAVMLAKKTGRKKLTDRQKKIYELVKSKGKAKTDEIAKELGLNLKEAEREIAVLRHLELVKGKKEIDGIFIVPFDS